MKPEDSKWWRRHTHELQELAENKQEVAQLLQQVEDHDDAEWRSLILQRRRQRLEKEFLTTCLYLLVICIILMLFIVIVNYQFLV